MTPSRPTAPQHATDEQLLGEFVRGDRASLGRLAERYERALLGMARGLTGGRDDLACDAVQEMWMRVIRYGASFNGNSSVKTWLYRILINQCRTMRSAAPGASALGDDKSRITIRPEIAEDRNESLHDAIERLSDEQREILLLCYHAGLTHSQAAEILHIPAGTLKSRLHSALESLRGSLSQELKT